MVHWDTYVVRPVSGFGIRGRVPGPQLPVGVPGVRQAGWRRPFRTRARGQRLLQAGSGLDET
eukprot:7773568-Lingulodinium_polyedra.AAC.1